MVLRLGLIRLTKALPVSLAVQSPAFRSSSTYRPSIAPPGSLRLSRLYTMTSTLTDSPMIGIIGMGDVSPFCYML